MQRDALDTINRLNRERLGVVGDPEIATRIAGYEILHHGEGRWNGVAILSRVGEIHETRRGLPGDPDDSHSRYIEAAVNGILIGGLYLPNGNPRPGPKFDYKLKWFDRLIEHAKGLLDSGLPVPLEPTIYARFKDWPLLGLLVLLGLGLAVATRLADEA